MKKFTYIILGLTVLGAAITMLLLMQHFFPDRPIGSMFCGGGLVNPCLELSQSRFATIFGLPIAAFGLLYYLLALFIVLIADYAAGKYHDYALLVLLPLSAAAMAADAALGAVLIATKILCTLCISTYAVNAGILAAAILWYRRARRDGSFSMAGTFRSIFSGGESNPDRRAFYASFVLYVFTFTFAILGFAYILKQKSDTGAAARQKIAPAQVQQFLGNFFRQPVEKTIFPETGIALGDPKAPMTIYVFTDFLCSACSQFYGVEKQLLARYDGKIRVVHYNFPLDQGCNSNVQRTIYQNSCMASRAFISAADAGFIEQYIVRHFSDYEHLSHSYSRDRAVEVLKGLDSSARKGIEGPAFLAMMDSPKTTERLNAHLELAKKLKIGATPTLYIGGRRIEGFPPMEVFEAIIATELAGK